MLLELLAAWGVILSGYEVWKLLQDGGGKEPIEYHYKLFDKNWKGLRLYLEEKLDRLDAEEREFQEKNKNRILKLDKKFPKLSRSESNLYQERRAWNQQMGKIIFISGILEAFWGKSEVRNRIWKERGWELKDDKITKKK